MDKPTLAERVRPPRRTLPCHVWIDEQPGVLLQWQRHQDAWWGRVVHPDGDGAGVESWLRADRIRPCE